MNYYNEFDPKAAAWIRALIKAGLIPEGVVDERDIKQVRPDELLQFRQCHFFAGIGGWSLALQLAGWQSERQVWTGSCPCQPLSCAGKRRGEKDERHLWPEFYRLISKCRPATIFGEQVASKDGIEWLDGISLDLEELDYAVASSDLPSAGVRAPNKRQRGWWVAHSRFNTGCSQQGVELQECGGRIAESSDGSMANSISTNEQQRSEAERKAEPARRGSPCSVAFSEGHGLARKQDARDGRAGIAHSCSVGQPIGDNLGRDARTALGEEAKGNRSGSQDGGGGVVLGPSSIVGGMVFTDRTRLVTRKPAAETARYGDSAESTGGVGFWDNAIWHPCSDGKIRRIPPEPSFFPLAPRLPGNVAMLRGFGNAINPEVAKEFIQSFLEAERDLATT